MGCSLIKFSTGTSYQTNPTNPNPSLFEIQQICQIGDFVLAEIRYVGCTNYEGNKIILWKGITKEEVLSMKEIDPHFTPNSKIVARFEPTLGGWSMALTLIKIWEE